MSRIARIYATTEGFTDTASAIEVKNALGQALGERLAAQQIRGWLAVVLADDDDFDEEGLDPEPIDAVTGGGRPTLWLNITYASDESTAHPEGDQDLITAHHLRLVTVLTDSGG